ncbi:hypothetical protein BsWGS_24894 [Bradybaena similaris]
MGTFCALFKGRLMWARSMFVIMSLCVVTLIMSEELREWFVSNTVNICMSMSYQQDNIPSSRNYSRTEFPHYNLTATDQMATACEFPKINPFEPSVMKIAGVDKKTLSCEGTFKPDLTYIEDGNKLKVNTSKVEKYVTKHDFKSCRYRNIYRHDTDDNDYKFTEWSKSFTDEIELPKDTEFFKVECTNNQSEVVSKTFYHLVPKKEEFDETDSLNLKKRNAMSAPKETLNIILLGLDTLTRNQFIRGCNKTYSYLMNELSSFDLTLHSQVGENTFPNFLALLTGHSYDEVKEWWSDKDHMDTFDMIWRTFESAGYRTLFTEDSPMGGAFHYLRKGFINKFARYNIRPLALAVLRDKDMFKKSYYCAGNQVEMNFQLDYLSTFLDTFPDKPVFAVAMISKPTHDQPSDAKMFDDHLLHYFKSWSEKGHLKRSVLINFSDHGVRHGALRNSVNGHVESKTPYTILTFPDWFLEKYPDLAENLQRNTERLTSHHDTHATLLDLLYFRSDTPPPLPPLKHGISLLDKVPWDRTCKDALIPSDFCLCGYKGVKEIDLASQLSEALAKLVVEALNSKTDKKVCAVYKLKKLIRILKSSFKERKEASTVYKVKLEVNPGKSLFEANVYETKNGTEWIVGSEIDRLNLYRGQADCLEFPTFRPFCYCNDLLKH